MTIRAQKFTPEVMLGSSRRSPGIPNGDGSQILYTSSTYSFETQQTTREMRVFDVQSSESKLLTHASASEPKWLDEKNLIFLSSGEEGATNVVIACLDDFKQSRYVAGVIPGPAGNFKIKRISDHKYFFTITAKATPYGKVYNPETSSRSRSTGRLYSKLFVRHWDTWLSRNHNSIFHGTLKRLENGKLSISEVQDVLHGTELECPIPPFGGGDHYDLSSTGVVFVAKDPNLNPAISTKCNLYFSDLKSDTKALRLFTTLEEQDFNGAKSSPVFSPDGQQVAVLSMNEDGYEADKNQVWIFNNILGEYTAACLHETPDRKGSWDRSPSSVFWSSDGKGLFLITENFGTVELFYKDLESFPKLPVSLPGYGSVSDAVSLPNGSLFVSGTSYFDNSIYWSFDSIATELLKGLRPRLISSNSKDGANFGVQSKCLSSVTFPGASPGVMIQAWVLKPSNFDSNKTYPLCYVIHGGPQGAWNNAWNTRWNPLVFAEQQYVVVAVNPTGSTGFGQALTDAIQGQWGGLPYQDIVNGFDHIKSTMSYVDTSRSVILGASYGGYMMNWVQGQPLGRRFKAIVCHDGVFNIPAQLATEELWFPYHEFRGKYWQRPSEWHKWDPARFTGNWATPMLVIHSERDFRLTDAEGLAAFNVLQTRGVDSQFLTFPDENHWVLDPENSLLWHACVLDWINERVGLPKYTETSELARKVKEEAWHDRDFGRSK